MREKIKNYLKERYSDIGIKKEIIMINSAIVSAAVLLTFLFFLKPGKIHAEYRENCPSADGGAVPYREQQHSASGRTDICTDAE